MRYLISTAMITHVRIKNYRCFVDTEVDLQPFSLVVGANGSGKSNFLRFFPAISGPVKADNPAMRILQLEGGGNLDDDLGPFHYVSLDWQRHQNHKTKPSGLTIEFQGKTMDAVQAKNTQDLTLSRRLPWQGTQIPVFDIDPERVSGVEHAIPKPFVHSDGAGTAQVLDSLKNGDLEDLFDGIEENLRRYVPEVEKLSLRTVEKGRKQIQVREKGLAEPLSATELSEGTRLILCVLTILHQEKPPALILLEDVDRGMHPRLFEQVAPLMRDIAERNRINIIATSHNPYLVDCFQDHKDAVIIAEKKDGASTLTTLADKLQGLDYENVDPDDMPLGALWYTGLVGGTPRKAGAATAG